MPARTVVFDVREPYYIQHFTPISHELDRRGVRCIYVVYRSADPTLQAVVERAVAEQALDAVWVEGEAGALAHYKALAPDWVCFANSFSALNDLPARTRTAQFWHGVGPKSVVYDADLTQMDVRFVEGDHRLARLRQLYPARRFVQAGFPKLDPLFSGKVAGIDLEACGLDPAKPTLLYAPTFYPSSLEMFADAWPREFSEYNLIVKPHFFSWTKSRYKKQRRKLQLWSAAPNVYVPGIEHDSLLPFMASADILISEASSSLFEFAALDKPVIWCDFLKLRWSYRGPLRFRFKRRMDPEMNHYDDVGAHVARYQDLKRTVARQLARPAEYAANRRRCTRDLVGPVDGCASARTADYLLAEDV